MVRESFKYKIWINLGVAFFSILVMLISVFSQKWDIYKNLEGTLSGIWLGLILINGLEWARLEQERKWELTQVKTK